MMGFIELLKRVGLTHRFWPRPFGRGFGAVALFLCATAISPVGVGAFDDPAAGIEPVVDTDFYDDGAFPAAKVRLGKLLFFDKILSGNRNIACVTCHHPRFATSDGIAMPLGEGAVGLGPARRVVAMAPVIDRVPRNSQALFFRGGEHIVQAHWQDACKRSPNMSRCSATPIPRSSRRDRSLMCMPPTPSPRSRRRRSAPTTARSTAICGPVIPRG